jgi:hypothetical protein
MINDFLKANEMNWEVDSSKYYEVLGSTAKDLKK